MTNFPCMGRFTQFLSEAGIAHRVLNVDNDSLAPPGSLWQVQLRTGAKNVLGSRGNTASFYFDRYGTLLKAGINR